jgi:signal transduction histidine kinase
MPPATFPPDKVSAESLQRITEDFLVSGTMRTSFSLIGEPQEMHPIVRDEVYRIGYEANRNADSHLEAALLQLELIYGRDLTMRIRDNEDGLR